MKTKTPDLGDEKVDLTSMVDVVFLLIIFFMVIAVQLTAKIEVEIPKADQAKIPKETGRRMDVSIEPDGTLYVGLVEHSLEQLAGRIQEDKALMPDFKVYIRTDLNTPHEHVRDVMQACADMGVYDIIFATFQWNVFLIQHIKSSAKGELSVNESHNKAAEWVVKVKVY